MPKIWVKPCKELLKRYSILILRYNNGVECIFFVKKGRKEPNQNENILPSLLPTGFFIWRVKLFGPCKRLPLTNSPWRSVPTLCPLRSPVKRECVSSLRWRDDTTPIVRRPKLVRGESVKNVKKRLKPGGWQGTRCCLGEEGVRVNAGLGAKRWQGKGLLEGGLAPCQRLEEVRPLHLRQPLPPVFNSDEQGRQLDNFDMISCT